MVRVTAIGEAYGRVLIELSDVEHGPAGLAPQVTFRYLIEGEQEPRAVTAATNTTMKEVRKAIEKATQRKDLGQLGFKTPADVPLGFKMTRSVEVEPLAKHWRLGKFSSYGRSRAKVRAGKRTKAHDAAATGNLETLQAFLDKPARMNARDAKRVTLHTACKAGQFEAVKMLVAAKADINAISDNGTPLTFAAVRRNTEMVEFLIIYGSDPNLC
jgi:N-methylhydantoinase A/oxoprolinase/acetone carboxylase beta subunit